MKSGVDAARLWPWDKHPTYCGDRQQTDENWLQHSDTDCRGNHTSDDGEQRASHARKDKNKGQSRGVLLRRKEFGAQGNARCEEGSHYETDQGNGNRGGDDVGNAVRISFCPSPCPSPQTPGRKRRERRNLQPEDELECHGQYAVDEDHSLLSQTVRWFSQEYPR